MASEKKRISVTLTTPYLKALAYLSGEGLFLDRGAVIRAGLRLIFKAHGVPPFHLEDEN